MTTPMEAAIASDTESMLHGRLSLEMSGIAHPNMRAQIMIQRVQALCLISRYNAHFSGLGNPGRHVLEFPEDITDFGVQLDWIITQIAAETKTPDWLIPERIKGGIRIFVYDFTYVEITRVYEGARAWYNVRVFSVTAGGRQKPDMMCRLLLGLLEERTWLDEPDPREMILGLGL